MVAPVLIRLLKKVSPQGAWRSETFFRYSVLILTFISYTAFHLSRKPLSIVKNSHVFMDCGNTSNLLLNSTCSSWITEIDGEEEPQAKTYLGFLDTAYLVSYSFFMFVSGFVAERVDLRFFLTIGMLMSGAMTIMFGMAYSLNIHSIWYLIVMQIANGMFQSSGWPGVVSVMANWFGKGKRGFIMGAWNSHTSFGNILGSLVAGAFVTSNWGLSFIVPGIIVAALGIVMLLLLVPHPEDIGFSSVTESKADNNSTEKLDDQKWASSNSNENDIPADKLEDKKWTPNGSNVVNIADEEVDDQANSSNAIGFLGALKIPGVLEFALCLFFSKLVSYTFLFWLPHYIHSQSHVNAEDAANLSTYFDWGGIIGGILAGFLTDRTGMSATTCSVMLMIAIPVMFFYQRLVEDLCPISSVMGDTVYDSCFYWNVAILFLTGLLVNGPYALITTAVSAELGQHPSLAGSKKALATVTAIIDGTGSIGAAIGPFIAGPLSSNSHWERVFYMLMGADVMALMLLVRLVKNEFCRLRSRGWRLSPDDR